ncbi:MAG: preprotein translocase subunit SecG [Parvularcula sp.]|nr:preprotein translocase subunit SecG [Parvularcula sp.]
MTAVILTIHTLIVIALIGVVLLQRSDGGALGLGGGGGGGGFMTGRGAANALTRTTSILAAGFFATSLILATRAGAGEDDERVIDELTGAGAPVVEETSEPGEITTEDLLNDLGTEDATADEPATTEDLINDLGGETPPAGDAAAEESPAEDAPSEEETPQE